MDGVEWVGLLALGGAGATVALVQGIKMSLKLPKDLESRVTFPLAIACGLFWNWLLLTFLAAPDARLVTIALFGLMSGLSASGLWSGSKATVGPRGVDDLEAERLKYLVPKS